MSCGCGGSAAQKQTYIFTDANGKQVSYKTEIEARAAKIRANHEGSIRAVPVP
jgi:uncharacterized membrane protein